MTTFFVGALLAGCAVGQSGPGVQSMGGPSESLLEMDRPGDFVLGLVVLGPAAGVRGPEEAPARYILSADGWLRTAVGPGSRESVYPKRTRLLSADERDRIWDFVRASEIDSIQPPLQIQSPESFDAPAGRRVYLVQLTANGARRSVAMPQGLPETAPFVAIADQLAAWSWVQP